MPQIIQNISNLCRKGAQRGSALVEFAMLAPFLILLLSGVLTIGDLLTQQPWLAHSTYQLAEVLATTPEESGPTVMMIRYGQLLQERDARFQRLNLVADNPQPLFGSEYYGNLTSDGLRVAGVRFGVTLRTLWGITIPTPMTIEVVAPQIVKQAELGSFATFADPPQEYDCCGRVCGSPGAACTDLGGGNYLAAICDPSAAATPLCGLL